MNGEPEANSALVLVERQATFLDPIVLSNFGIALIALLVPLISFWLGKRSERSSKAARVKTVKKGIQFELEYLKEQIQELDALLAPNSASPPKVDGRRIQIPIILDYPPLWIDHLSAEKINELSHLLSDVKRLNRHLINLNRSLRKRQGPQWMTKAKLLLERVAGSIDELRAD